MDRYAKIVDGVVYQVIEAATALDGVHGAWVACGDAGPGWLYDGTRFTAPVLVPAPALPWTKKEFLLKFTPVEYGAIIDATKTNATVDYYWQVFMVAENVLKTDPVTIGGMQAMEALGLLAPGRAAEILA